MDLNFKSAQKYLIIVGLLSILLFGIFLGFRWGSSKHTLTPLPSEGKTEIVYRNSPPDTVVVHHYSPPERRIVYRTEQVEPEIVYVPVQLQRKDPESKPGFDLVAHEGGVMSTKKYIVVTRFDTHTEAWQSDFYRRRPSEEWSLDVQAEYDPRDLRLEVGLPISYRKGVVTGKVVPYYDVLDRTPGMSLGVSLNLYRH
jgi:hypothetical protein